jgi:hypothetical protein
MSCAREQECNGNRNNAILLNAGVSGKKSTETKLFSSTLTHTDAGIQGSRHLHQHTALPCNPLRLSQRH